MTWTPVLVTAALPAAEGGPLGARLPLLSLLPFLALLGAIAVLPLIAHHWWESNRNKGLVSAAIAIPFAVWFVSAFGAEAAHEISHSVLDYLAFMALLGSLFVISGGIHVRGSLSGTPLANSVLLGLGAVLANLIGTTGASMVLIRPLLRANEGRKRLVHTVIFFIFVVSNCGGLLTPLGDPPLFLGFLKGVPFEWTLRLWKEWLLVNGLLIVIFNVVDQILLARDEREGPEDLLEEMIEHEPLRIDGWHNLFFLAGVVAVIVANGARAGTAPESWPFGVQEGLMGALAFFAYITTHRDVRGSNRFTFKPIIEVALLFAGIFTTMVAPLVVLNARGAALGVTEPWQYFWATGVLSSFLDNAPTYLTFGALASGQLGVPVEGGSYLGQLLAQGPAAAALLAAISCGAVFMGANSYIGNGPNFMVKAIAEENGVEMPSFFGYMAWSVSILVPLFVIVTFIFYL